MFKGNIISQVGYNLLIKHLLQSIIQYLYTVVHSKLVHCIKYPF